MIAAAKQVHTYRCSCGHYYIGTDTRCTSCGRSDGLKLVEDWL